MVGAARGVVLSFVVWATAAVVVMAVDASAPFRWFTTASCDGVEDTTCGSYHVHNAVTQFPIFEAAGDLNDDGTEDFVVLGRSDAAQSFPNLRQTAMMFGHTASRPFKFGGGALVPLKPYTPLTMGAACSVSYWHVQRLGVGRVSASSNVSDVLQFLWPCRITDTEECASAPDCPQGLVQVRVRQPIQVPGTAKLTWERIEFLPPTNDAILDAYLDDASGDGWDDLIVVYASTGAFWYENIHQNGTFSAFSPSAHLPLTTDAPAIHNSAIMRSSGVAVGFVYTHSDWVRFAPLNPLNGVPTVTQLRLLPTGLSTPLTSFVVRDLDADGIDDVLVAKSGDTLPDCDTSRVFALKLALNGDHVSAPNMYVPVTGCIGKIRKVIAADLNRDGRPEIVAVSGFMHYKLPGPYIHYGLAISSNLGGFRFVEGHPNDIMFARGGFPADGGECLTLDPSAKWPRVSLAQQVVVVDVDHDGYVDILGFSLDDFVQGGYGYRNIGVFYGTRDDPCSAAGWFCTPCYKRLCPAGWACPTLSTITRCTMNGTYCPAGSTSSKGLCPAGSYCPNPSTRVDCPSGSTCGVGSETFHVCQAGTFAPSATASACERCERGFFAPHNSSTACLACPSLSYSADDRSSCTACPDVLRPERPSECMCALPASTIAIIVSVCSLILLIWGPRAVFGHVTRPNLVLEILAGFFELVDVVSDVIFAVVERRNISALLFESSMGPMRFFVLSYTLATVGSTFFYFAVLLGPCILPESRFIQSTSFAYRVRDAACGAELTAEHVRHHNVFNTLLLLQNALAAAFAIVLVQLADHCELPAAVMSVALSVAMAVKMVLNALRRQRFLRKMKETPSESTPAGSTPEEADGLDLPLLEVTGDTELNDKTDE